MGGGCLLLGRKGARALAMLAGMDLPDLERALDFWRDCGFEPWRDGAMAGVHRRITFCKNALLGEIGRYFADDYVVWTYEESADFARVCRAWGPVSDVVLQRFVFLGDCGAPWRKRRSYLFGIRGYLEVYYYVLGEKGDRQIADLVPLITRGWAVARGEVSVPNEK